jgi:hypothetical protein
MNAFLTPVLAALVLVGSTGGVSASDPTAAGGTPDPVYVDSTEIEYLESFPVQVRLLVKGSLPTPCHEAVFEVQDLGDRLDVLLWSLADPDQVCAQVLEPFELAIPLGSFESANVPVVLNGDEVGRVEIEGRFAGPTLVGAGWSFGFCLGYCNADVAIEGDDVIVTGRDRDSEEPLYVHRGTLTAEGRARLDAAAASLAGVALDPVYGCPDCADGGAAWVEIFREDVIERVEMEFGSPPEVLSELHAASLALIEALETCTSNELVDVADDCVAFERD